MPSSLSERSSARSSFSTCSSSAPRPAPQHLAQVLTQHQTRRRRSAVSTRARVRGFTLVETAISGIVVAGITASLLLAVRYTQMVSQGKAVGQQMTAISDSAQRYMKQYSQQILALDQRCATINLQIDDGGPKPPASTTAGPDCKLVLSNITVANGYQPTVAELQMLGLSRASDALLLPFSPGVAVDKSTGEAAMARVAVAIRPVRRDTSGGGSSTGGTNTGTPTGFVPGINNSLGGYTFTYNDFSYKTGMDADRDLPPTINGISCYKGSIDNAVNSATLAVADRVYVYANDDRKVYPAFNEAEIVAATAHGGPYDKGVIKSFLNGKVYCRYLQQRYGMGLIGSSGSTTGGGTPGTGSGNGGALTLESMVFNTQPYYFGTPSLPFGAAAQLGAALQETGYAGRMSLLKADGVKSKNLLGLQGQSRTDNPILSKDGSQGLPGVLAAVNLLAEVPQAAGGPGGTGTGWDAGGNSITNAGLIQGQQVAANTGVFGSGQTVDTRGRPAVLAVNGNVALGKNSVLMAAGVESSSVRTESSTARQSVATNAFADSMVLPSLLSNPINTLVGRAATPHNLYLYNGTRVRLPRVKLGDRCDTNGDIGLTRALSIQVPNGNVHVMTRFIAFCRPELTNTKTQDGNFAVSASTWSSAEFETLRAKYPTTSYNYVWFDATQSDLIDAPPGDDYPLIPDSSIGGNKTP